MANTAFATKVKITGSEEYQKALKNISLQLKETSSQMKVVTSAFDKNDKSSQNLTKQSEVLSNKLKLQQQYLEQLKNKYTDVNNKVQQSANQHKTLEDRLNTETAKLKQIESTLGKSSSEYQNQAKVVQETTREYNASSKAQDQNQQTLSKLRIELNNAQSDYNKTDVELKNVTKSLEETSDSADDLTDSIKKAGKEATDSSKGGFTILKGTIANLASSAIQSAIGALKKLGGTLISVSKQALESYAEYEQLSGGVETLFKDSASVVEGYANQAYKTAGLSANEYMSTVTSFSASLLQGLGGDTKKAAEVADMAIIDMSDNANKMGTSMEMIQNAYQGFAKQNYTMLDNLKLGYGGTKSEMVRLVKESGILGKAADDLTVKNFDQKVSYDQIIQAIHKVQENMGITGTTAKEASTTIEGSVNTVKASWQNLLTGIADGNQDIKPLVQNLSDSIITAMRNIIPRVIEIIKGLGEVFKVFVNETLPQIIEELPPKIQTKIKKIQDVFNWFVKNKGLVAGAIGTMIAAFAITKIATFITSIASLVTLIKNLELATKLQTAAQWLLNTAMNANPIGLVIAGITALVAAFAVLWNKSEAFRNFWIGLWENVKQAVGSAVDWIKAALNKIVDFIKNNWQGLLLLIVNPFVGAFKLLYDNCEGFRNFVDEVTTAIADFFKNAWNDIKNTWSNVANWFNSNVISPIAQFFSNLWNNLKNGAVNAWNNVTSAFSRIGTFFSNMWNTIKSGFTSIGTKVADAIGAAFKSAINGVIGTVENAINFIPRAINGAINQINKLPGVEIGKMSYVSLPRLAKGGVLEKGQLGLLEGSGAEAVVPLEKNTEWIRKVSNQLQKNMVDNNVNKGMSYNEMVDGFKEALSQMKIELDDENMGKFVTNTITNAIYN